jgi:lactate permease
LSSSSWKSSSLAFLKFLMAFPIDSANFLVIAAGTAIAGGLASVISPAKLQNAAATIDAMGIESKVIRVAVVISIIFTSVAAVLTFIWA